MPVCTACRRCSPIGLSASSILVSARRIALPTATLARSGSSGNDRVRPRKPAALASCAVSQSCSARAVSAPDGSPAVSSWAIRSSSSRTRAR